MKGQAPIGVGSTQYIGITSSTLLTEMQGKGCRCRRAGLIWGRWSSTLRPARKTCMSDHRPGAGRRIAILLLAMPCIGSHRTPAVVPACFSLPDALQDCWAAGQLGCDLE